MMLLELILILDFMMFTGSVSFSFVKSTGVFVGLDVLFLLSEAYAKGVKLLNIYLRLLSISDFLIYIFTGDVMVDLNI